MILKQLSLLNFKNFDSADFQFDKKINCFVGMNGVGKTNALDAIYYLAFGKSYFNPLSSQNIKHGEDFFVVEGVFDKDQKEEKIVCSLKKGSKKILKRNAKIYEKLSDHIGFLPLVIISPSDRDLIVEGSETRRKFIDGVIAQSDKMYLDNLISYNKIVAQRNALLKYFALNQTFNNDTLEVYNHQLAGLATEIYKVRKDFIEKLAPIFKEQYRKISKDKEEVSLSYKSQLHDATIEDLLQSNLQRDRILQYTTVGTHKDDIKFKIGNYPIKKFGSQGQQKSFLIALKLAQYAFIKERLKTNPILLLDDIFDKLDDQRVAELIKLVNMDTYGQIFISDTHRDRTEEVIKSTDQSYALIELQ
jgi:DNA replication and repair protein RecF